VKKMSKRSKPNKISETPVQTNPVDASKANPVLTSLQASFTAGPIPAPEILEHYNAIVPGSADIIISVFDRQASHRQALEVRSVEIQAESLREHFELMRASQKSDYRLAMCGQISAFLITMSFLFGSVYCIVSGFPTSGTILGGLSLTTLVGIFIYGSRGAGFKTQDFDSSVGSNAKTHAS
jgi:uncharacterized membrane protein